MVAHELPGAPPRRHPGGPRRVRAGRRARPSGSPRATTCCSAPATTPRVVAFPDGRVVVSTDLLVDARHFRRDWASAEDIGHRVAAAKPLRHQRDGRRRHRADRRASPRRRTCPPSGRSSLADGIAEEAALVGAERGRRRRHRRRPGHDLGHRARRASTASRSAGRGHAPATCVALAGRQGWAAGGAGGARPRLPLAPRARRGAPPSGAAVRRGRRGAARSGPPR